MVTVLPQGFIVPGAVPTEGELIYILRSFNMRRGVYKESSYGIFRFTEWKKWNRAGRKTPSCNSLKERVYESWIKNLVVIFRFKRRIEKWIYPSGIVICRIPGDREKTQYRESGGFTGIAIIRMDEHTFFRANDVNPSENQRTADFSPGNSSQTEIDAEPGKRRETGEMNNPLFCIIRFIKVTRLYLEKWKISNF